MKKFWSIFLLMLLLFSSVESFAADRAEQSFPEQREVSLNHVWTIRFNRPLQESDRAQIGVTLVNETLNQSLVMKAYIDPSDPRALKVAPQRSYLPDSVYRLEVRSPYLHKLYTKRFHTLASSSSNDVLRQLRFMTEVGYVDIFVRLDGSKREEIRIYETDENGKVLSLLGNMRDDGNAPDQQANDRVFSFRHPVSSSEKQQKYYRVEHGSQILTGEVRTAVPITEKDVRDAEVMIDQADTLLQKTAEKESAKVALEKAKDWLEEQSEVENIRIVSEEDIYFESNNVPSMITIRQEGEKSSENPETGAEKESDLLQHQEGQSPDQAEYAGMKELISETAEGSETEQSAMSSEVFEDFLARSARTGKTFKVLILEPYQKQFGDSFGDTLDAMRAHPSVFEIKRITGNDVTLQRLQEMSSYDIILISSHGTADAASENVYIAVPDAWFRNDSTHIKDELSAGRLRKGRSTLLVSEEYIDFYCGNFNDAYVHVSSCKSARIPDMANVFLNHNADCYVGYSNTVWAKYSEKVDNRILTAMVAGKSCQQGTSEANEEFFEDDEQWYMNEYGSYADDDYTPASIRIFGNNSHTFVSHERQAIEDDPYYIWEKFPVERTEDYLLGNWIGRDVFTYKGSRYNSEDYFFIRRNANGTYDIIDRMIVRDPRIAHLNGKSVVFKYSNLIYNPQKQSIFLERAKSEVLYADPELGNKWRAANINFFLSGGVFSCTYRDGVTAHYEKYFGR